MRDPSQPFDLTDGGNLDDELAVLEIETEIARLDGVVAVRLVKGEHRPIDELHVVISPGRGAERTARDLQGLLLARFGLPVDRSVISVVHLEDETTRQPQGALPRLSLDAVHLAVRSHETTISVELLDGDRTLLGHAGPVADAATVAATAEATLDAMRKAAPDLRLRLVTAKLTGLGADRVALVSVQVDTGRHSDVLTGSARVRRNAADAVARAVLDATNRLRPN